jgi:hypothetical protein
MKHASLAAAVVIVLSSNAFALLHAARNRSGDPDAQIALTDRELSYYRDADDSGVALNLIWLDANARYGPWVSPDDNSKGWMNRQVLESLGFDCSVDPADRVKADSFYARQSPRRGFIALEYDGPGWREWLELRQRQIEQQPALRDSFNERQSSRLVAIDAAGDPAALRARHPDRSKVVILPAVIQISVTPRMPAAQGRPEIPAQLTGWIQQVSYSVHVSRPISDKFRALRQTTRGPQQEDPVYRVHLKFGSLLEPWVTDAEFAEE